MGDGFTMVGSTPRGGQGRGRGMSPQWSSPQDVVARVFDRSSRFHNEWRAGRGRGNRWEQGFGMERGNGRVLDMNVESIKEMIGQIARNEMSG